MGIFLTLILTINIWVQRKYSFSLILYECKSDILFKRLRRFYLRFVHNGGFYLREIYFRKFQNGKNSKCRSNLCLMNFHLGNFTCTNCYGILFLCLNKESGRTYLRAK